MDNNPLRNFLLVRLMTQVSVICCEASSFFSKGSETRHSLEKMKKLCKELIKQAESQCE